MCFSLQIMFQFFLAVFARTRAFGGTDAAEARCSCETQVHDSNFPWTLLKTIKVQILIYSSVLPGQAG